MDPETPDFVMETFIRTTPERLWAALTEAALHQQFHFACQKAVGDTKAAGDQMAFHREDGSTLLTHTVLSVDPGRRIELRFQPGWIPDAASSRIAYALEPQGDVVKLTMEHFAIPEGQDGVREGWARWASSLKSFLETGTPIRMPR